MVDLLDRKLIFVTGKGGVGKTTIAAALAWLAAGLGKRTLVCEVEPKGDLADFYETRPDLFRRTGDRSEAVGDVDGHGGVAEAVPVAAAEDPAGRPNRAAGEDVRLRGLGGARASGRSSPWASCAGR